MKRRSGYEGWRARHSQYMHELDRDDSTDPDLCRKCHGLGCDACQQTCYEGGREP